MKILATFDRTAFSESILPVLEKIAALPDAEFTLLTVAHEPHARIRGGMRTPIVGGATLGATVPVVIPASDPSFAENKEQAVERRIAEMQDYLLNLGRQLPKGTSIHVEAHISEDAAETIIERAKAEQPDVIVMATRSRGGLGGALFGTTTDKVVRSGVAPVLLVHPKE